jgi:hypothetical protein
MTRPKHPPHRLGFIGPGHDRSQKDIQASARGIWFHTVAHLEPAVLATLGTVPADTVCGLELDDPNEQALAAWAAGWHLSADWCVAAARATWRLWRRYPGAQRGYWAPRDDLKGKRYRPRPGRQALRPLKKSEHFAWLAAFQVLGLDLDQITGDCGVARLKARPTSLQIPPSRDAAADAIRTLATLLDLPLRPTRRGRKRDID